MTDPLGGADRDQGGGDGRPDATAPDPTAIERWLSPERAAGIAALIYGVFWFTAFRYFGGRSTLHADDGPTLAVFGGDEPAFFVQAFLFQVALAGWLWLRMKRAWPPALSTLWADLKQNPRRAYVAFAAMAGALALIVGLGVLGAHPITEDEKTTLFQAHLLIQGRLSVPVPEGAVAFWQPFVVMPAGRWSGQYPWGQSALLIPGVLLGNPWVVPPVEAAITVYFTARLAEEYTGDSRAGLLAAALGALSPIVVLSGGTLHNANLAAACAAASLWGFVRVSERPGWAGWITLGVATGLGIHARAMDQAAISVGCGILLLLRFRRDLPGLARALGPAILVSLPIVALLPISNHFAYGRWSTTGYALFNGNHGWVTMGFGRGPFDTPHTLRIAMAKTVTAFVRVAFYETGSPLGFCLLAAPFLAPRRRGIAAIAPAVPALVVGIGYFFYAASSIDPTGPVYYLALTPLLLAWAAVTAVDLHDGAGEAFGASRPWARRALPAFLIAQAAAAIVVFWPAQVGHLLRNADQSADCETTLQQAGIERALVFTVTLPPERQLNSWHRAPPLTEPPFDAPVLWARPRGFAEDARAIARFAGDRRVVLETCFGRMPSVLAYDPTRRTLTSLDGKASRRIEDAEMESWLLFMPRDQADPPRQPGH